VESYLEIRRTRKNETQKIVTRGKTGYHHGGLKEKKSVSEIC